MAGYQVITEALRKEAPKWWAFADKVAPVSRDVRDARLGVTSFFVGDPFVLGAFLNAETHNEVYERFRAFMESVLTEAVTEFDQIGDALVKIADEYERAEKIVELDLTKAYSR